MTRTRAEQQTIPAFVVAVDQVVEAARQAGDYPEVFIGEHATRAIYEVVSRVYATSDKPHQQSEVYMLARYHFGLAAQKAKQR